MQFIFLQSAQGGGDVFLALIFIFLMFVVYYYYLDKRTNNQLKVKSGKDDMKMDFIESSNSWDCISTWFKDIKDRSVVISEFNNAAQISYVNGKVPYQLKSSKSRGEKLFKHSTSDWLNSGFRISILTDQLVSEKELNRIGLSVLADSKVVRFLITLGWDTLEVVNIKGKIGLHWQLSKWATERNSSMPQGQVSDN